MQGLHLLADLGDCEGGVALDDAAALRACCLEAVAATGLSAVGDLFHPFLAADRRPLGVTGVVLLAESHLAIHTWPELRGVTADVYVCNLVADNSERARRLMETIVAAFQPGRRRIEEVSRG